MAAQKPLLEHDIVHHEPRRLSSKPVGSITQSLAEPELAAVAEADAAGVLWNSIGTEAGQLHSGTIVLWNPSGHPWQSSAWLLQHIAQGRIMRPPP